MGAVTIRDIAKRYDAVEVLKGVSIDITDGEFLVLVGPSGCGKSTLLRMIAGLEEITDGTIAIDGEVINDLAPKDRDIAMVFQSYALYPHMTVRRNMEYALRLKGMDRGERERRVARAADILGLTDYLDRMPKQLSGGQRQRVAMGRAIVRDPKVYLFDEPLSNLDAKLRVQMRFEIKQNHARLSTTTVYVTHDQVEAMTMADRIVVMNKGRIEQIGRPLELYDNPANLFVAGFIGSPAMNMIEGDVSGDIFTTADGTQMQLGAIGADAEGRTVLGVRPESFELDPDGIAVEVLGIEPTGAESQILVRLGGEEVVVVLRERLFVQPGEFIHITPVASAINLFDARSGLRISPDRPIANHKLGVHV
ncbi:MAG: sn-glycerol-3-phosphate ABC transporter ATP-binding protein UgpC [Hoeflea sp.]|uniref:ABC transporter ATP-binding protein n=1 Tax=Hoeflea sp. TaxID=1940281 RepID=UPI0032EE9999